LRIGFNGIFCFSTFTLTLATQLGFLIAGGSFFLMGAYVIFRLMGWETHANSTLVILITFLGGVQLTVLGILGEYVGRIFEQGQQRPLYLIDQIQGEPLSIATNPAKHAQGYVSTK
jgi:dolichol-phosphate mannosyltransferase